MGAHAASATSFEQVLEHLYKAALADVSWTSAAGLLNELIQTTGHALLCGDSRPMREPEIYMSRFFVGTEHREDLEDLYFRDYYWRDEANQRLFGLADGDLVRTSDLYSEEEMKTSAAYNEFRRVNKVQDGLFMTLLGLDGCGIVWTLGNSATGRGWGHDQIQTIERLSPHVRQFVRLRHALTDANALGASMASLLENRRSNIVQLDWRGHILEANDGARNILLKRDGLCDEKGVLAAVNQTEDAGLRRLLRQAVPRYGRQGAGGSMKITRRNTRAPLILEFHPLRGMGGDDYARRVRALVLIVDPETRPRVDPELAGLALGLTPTECRVAMALTTGETASGIATVLGCAESTVKTHLKRVYRKLGIRKQTELVQRVLSLGTLQ